MIFATDLDRTLIFSKKFIRNTRDITCVEVKENGEQISFMETYALELFKKVKREVTVVPVTTRSLEQYNRIWITRDTPFAIVANGGIILQDGTPMHEWEEKIKKDRDFTSALELLRPLEKFLTRAPQVVNDTFIFMKVPDDIVKKEMILDEVSQMFGQSEYNFTLQGVKLYIIPKEITKENALRFLSDYTGDKNIVTAGDGKLDVGFLSLGTTRYIPNRSEILSHLPSQFDFKLILEGLGGTEEMLNDILNTSKETKKTTS